MPVLTSEPVSQLAVELLARSLVLPMTSARVPSADYGGSGGTTIVRVPQRLTANQHAARGAQIVYGTLDEVAVPVELTHWYSALRVSDEELTLDIRNFGEQVLAPMVAAVAEAGEQRLANVINAVPATLSFASTADPDDTRAVILAAREALVTANVPAGGRYLAVSPAVASRLFAVDAFVRVDASGSPSALRDATLGRIFGLDVVESNTLTDGTAAVYHRSATAFATLSPALPAGAGSAQASAVQGIALRVLQDFDPGVLSDVVAVSTFGGAALVDGNRIVRIDTTVAI